MVWKKKAKKPTIETETKSVVEEQSQAEAEASTPEAEAEAPKETEASTETSKEAPNEADENSDEQKESAVAAKKPEGEHWLRHCLAPLRRRFTEIFAISLFTNMLALAVPLYTLQVYDRVVGHQATTTLVALATGVILAIIFDFLLRAARSRLLQDTAIHIDAQLGRHLYNRFRVLPLHVLESKPTNYWRSLFQDTQIIRSVFSGPSAVLVADIPFALLYLIVIFIIATPIAWALLIIIPAFLLLTWWSTRKVAQASATETKRNLTHDMLISEMLAGRVTVKSLRIDAVTQPHYEDLHADSIEESYLRGVKTDNSIALGQSLSLSSTALLVTLGALAIINGEMTIGALIATTMLTSRIIAPLNQLLSSWRGFARCKQAIDHLDTLEDLPREKDESALERPRPQGVMQVEDITVRYEGADQPIIKNCSFVLQPGQMVGLVGRNGCGKSTLVKTLQGLYTPEAGRILLDGADINQFSRAEMTQWVGYVPQECFLFNGTIRENIAKAWPEATDQSVLAAARLAGADEFIIDLPNGYDTEIGEDGNRLSGGQRQRLAIARALLRNPPVLLLDEVTSNLDSASELRLRQHLMALAKDRSIVVATHSLPILRSCNRIIVMESGKISKDGPAQEVLEEITGKDPASQQKGRM